MATIKFNQYQIQNLLIQLGITFDSNKVRNGWMSILCPLHQDRNFGNASINLESGVISCFSCNQNVSVLKLYMKEKNYSYTEAINNIFENSYSLNSSLVTNTKKRKEQSFKTVIIDDYTTTPLIPDDFYYTKIRGYTKEFCEKFGIVRCLGSEYDDYFLTPIIDIKKNINIIEARKLKQREYIYKFFKTKEFVVKPEEYFEEYKKVKGLHLNKKYDILDKDNKIINNFYLKYLLKPKTLYPKETDIDFTIWNIDNLDRNKNLIVSEGLATIPKIYLYIFENCTSIFGVKVTDDQLFYLKEFKEKIIIIPDNDEASLELIKFLNTYLNNIYVFDIKINDTHEDFVKVLKSCNILSANEYILKKCCNY